ncbi:hypothetical protein [Streptomyces mirabilis]|uniref:hypothetical protein n=1 Tax=Streptomyces mirabilis TaxID=68239 RepID=UPI0006BB2727|nr:hypothetical protein [Streptomyces mirabilis]
MQHRLRGGGARVLADGVTAQAEPAGNFAQAQALLNLGADGGVGVAEPVEEPSLRVGLGRLRVGRRRLGLGFW